MKAELNIVAISTEDVVTTSEICEGKIKGCDFN